MLESAKNRRTDPRRTPVRGFTLLELLVVLGILTLLAGFLVPSVMSLITAQRVDQCKEILWRIATAIHERARNVGRSLYFQKALLANAPQKDPADLFSTYYPEVMAHYFPFEYDPSGPLGMNLNSLQVLTYPPTYPYPLPGGGTLSLPDAGGPFLSGPESQFGATSGKDILKDPWENLLIWSFPNGISAATAWERQTIGSFGPAGMASGAADPNLNLHFHLYLDIREITLEKLEVVNEAVRRYNEVNLPGRPLPVEFWDRDWNDEDTAYEILVLDGYLSPPTDPDDPAETLDSLAIDGWGYLLVTDVEASLTGAAPLLYPFSIAGPVMQVHSLSHLLGGPNPGKCFYLGGGKVPSCF